MSTTMTTMSLNAYFDAMEPTAPLAVRPRPDWVDASLYPFESRFFETPAGAIHYVDEGTGEPVVFVHGTPTWSFVFRDLVARLRATHRCIALDHLGFGLSDKPDLQSFDHTPRAHSENLERLLDRLGLSRVTLVVHDFGGPIGLAFAARNPGRVRRIVVMNSWAWSNAGDQAARRIGGFIGSGIGRFLYTWCNFAVHVMLPMAFADRRTLTPSIRRHYAMPFARRRDRVGPWALGRELSRSNAFFDSVWTGLRARPETPMLVAWGTKDPAFGERHLSRWLEAFPNATLLRIDAGHFVEEEAPTLLAHGIEAFLARAS